MVNPKLPRRRAILGATAVVGAALASVSLATPAGAAAPPTVPVIAGVLTVIDTRTTDPPRA